MTRRAAYWHRPQSARILLAAQRRQGAPYSSGVTTKSHASASSDVIAVDSESTVRSIKLSSLITQRASGRQCSNHRRRAVNMKLPTATMKSHRVASTGGPVIDGESIVCRNEPSSLVTSRAAYRHCQQSRVSRRHRYRWREARLAAPGCRVSSRNMRRVGNASKRRQRVVNIKPLTATMTSHRVASADAPVIDGESIVCSNEPTSLVTSRAAYRHCSRRRRVENTKHTTATTKSRTSSLFRRHHHRP